MKLKPQRLISTVSETSTVLVYSNPYPFDSFPTLAKLHFRIYLYSLVAC